MAYFLLKSTMKRSTILAGGIVLFGAGLLAGHYGTMGIATGLSDTNVKKGVINAPISLPRRPPLSNFGTGKNLSAQGSRFPSNSQASMKSSSAGRDSSSAPSLPPHEFVMTAEEQAQFMVQQQEAKQANIEQIEVTIQSMKENGLPEEDIKAFSELKKAMEEQPIVESEPVEINQHEPTAEETINDFAASLEQSGMPRAQRDKMIEDFSSSLESAKESPDDLNVEPPLPNMQEQ
jgi:hypothetical protein